MLKLISLGHVHILNSLIVQQVENFKNITNVIKAACVIVNRLKILKFN